MTLTYKQRLARILIEKSYQEGDFTLASGKKSDYYFDCRQTALHPEGAWLIGNLFFELIKDMSITGVAGMTLGADPLVSATSVISFEQGKPLAGLIVRKEAKGHGTNQYVEGLNNFSTDDNIILLEDVVTTAGSVLKACKRLEDVKLNIKGICCILDREEGGRECLENAGYTLHSIYTRKQLLTFAYE